MTPLRIGLVGHFLYNSGCSQAVLGYVRAARHLGYDLRISKLSLLDKVVTKQLPMAEADWKPDRLVLIFESYQYLSEQAISHILRVVPRAHRLIIDHDGKYSPITRVGTDTNHADEKSRHEWLELYKSLSDRIAQPVIGSPAAAVQRFLFFGVDRHRPAIESRPKPKMYDIAYIGNNWYRWEDMRWFIEGLAPIRARLGRIAVFGKWWSGRSLPGVEDHTYSDPHLLHQHGVEIHRSVPFDKVETAMGRAYANPLFIRPLLKELQFATPRMFETFAADTVPLLSPAFDYAEALYGPSIHPLRLDIKPAERVEYILSHYDNTAMLAREIAFELASKHSYELRLSELIALFE